MYCVGEESQSVFLQWRETCEDHCESLFLLLNIFVCPLYFKELLEGHANSEDAPLHTAQTPTYTHILFIEILMV